MVALYIREGQEKRSAQVKPLRRGGVLSRFAEKIRGSSAGKRGEGLKVRVKEGAAERHQYWQMETNSAKQGEREQYASLLQRAQKRRRLVEKTEPGYDNRGSTVQGKPHT